MSKKPINLINITKKNNLQCYSTFAKNGFHKINNLIFLHKHDSFFFNHTKLESNKTFSLNLISSIGIRTA